MPACTGMTIFIAGGWRSEMTEYGGVRGILGGGGVRATRPRARGGEGRPGPRARERKEARCARVLAGTCDVASDVNERPSAASIAVIRKTQAPAPVTATRTPAAVRATNTPTIA